MASPSDSSVTIASASPGKRLTVTLDRVNVEVHNVGEDFAPTCLNVLSELNPFGKHKPARRTILHGITCQIRPGEMMLVCGRPGSGCTSLLKIISNYQEEFEAVSGDIHYGDATPRQAQQFRSQIVMNTEDDIHFPTLKVAETIDFAASTKLSKDNTKEDTVVARDSILDRLGIGHTKSTMVGNEVIRGVSGGERKRVSLAEVLATQAPVQCWDNSTRGLDASNALDFGKLLRKAANEEHKSIAATLYQAGNGIYNQFDKVLVLAEGRQIYYGPASEAKQYFEDMGFECPPGANIGDFVTSVAVHTERKIQPGYEGKVPNTAVDFAERFCASPYYQRMLQESQTCPPASLGSEMDAMVHARDHEKNRSVGFLSREKSPYQVSFFKQVIACTIRQFQLMWGDRWSNAMQIASALILSLVTGSLFYNLSKDSTSIFTRPGALYFPILFFAMNKMSETTASFMGRPIVSRHKRLSYSRPSAFAFACTITDIPLVILTFSLYEIVYYFMIAQQMNAGKFFTSWFILILCILCFASLYRMIGAWCRHFGFASQISGWITMVYLLYGGYLIPVPTMHAWFRWINYLNPATYTYEALMANEMSDLTLDCVEPQLIPYGSGYNDDRYRGCAVQGTQPGATNIVGSEWLHDQYLFSAGHIWRNAGIIIAFWIFFAVMAAIGFELNQHSNSGSRILFTRKNDPQDASRREDVERVDGETSSAGLGQLSLSKTLFTFKDISYFVHHDGKELQLLNKVSGFVKPGQLVALMGSSGAGKTTLMDVVAQRKDSGRIEGSILVNGKPQGITFQRTTGYCEQNDIHEPTATVWESLIFAASLRQNYEVSMKEKAEYVVAIMDLLELTPLRNAIVGSPGSGLSIEQRKRLTLATELVAKPTLLFLDEPTSGLDGQSAHEICRFMRKLASFGQAIICTIHQPSATLFDAFDVLLLLARGGRTTYFGPTGEYSAIVSDYFARNGVPCPADSNPAEHIVDVVQGRFGTEIDWPQVWLDSPERGRAMAELDELNAGVDDDLEKVPTVDAANTSQARGTNFATPVWYQTKLVTRRQMIALWRNPDYIWNKIGLHVTNGLFGGFTFWMIGDGTFDLQLRLMAMLNFIFVAPGCINQMQPLFIQNRDIFETREKKSKTYHWAAFVAGQVVSETPALILCGTLAFVTWYFTVGFPVKASLSGQVYFEMLMYEFLYTSIGQAIAAYSPNAFFAALANPIILGAALINFCGVVVPYEQIQVFWRYWIYWLNPFTYLIQGLLTPVTWYVQVKCQPDELTYFSLPSNTNCGEYIGNFLDEHAGYVVDAGNSTMCAYCEYSTGADYLRTLNINASYYGWRSTGITALFCISSYILVFGMMKLRTKGTKTAS